MANKIARAQVVAKHNESLDRLIRRFKKQVKKEGIMEELAKREYYEKPSKKRRRKKLNRLRKIAQENSLREEESADD